MSSVFNLSSTYIDPLLTKLLNKGLNFVPTPYNVNITNTITDIGQFVTNLRRQFYFSDKPINSQINSLTKSKFKLKSNWVPPFKHLNLDQRLTCAKILKLPYITQTIKNRPCNITKQERILIKQLKNNSSVIVKQADKGGATVLMDNTLYLKEAYKQLSDIHYYTQITKPLTESNYDNIYLILKNMLKLKQISLQQFKFLLRPPHTIKNRSFYLLPKIHKPLDKWPHPNMPPGRPIVSDVNSESYYTAQYITTFLTPFSSTLPSFVKNSTEFKNKICLKPILSEQYLVTADIESLYTNMCPHTCLTLTKQYLNSFLNPSHTDNIIRLLEINLLSNDFSFNNNYYLQTHGVAMGKSFAPALANIYLANFDSFAINYQPHPPLLYTRYIDDLFFVWNSNLTELIKFQNCLNSLLPGIKLTFSHDLNSVNFLDTTIFKHNNLLHTKVYFKPTDRHSLLTHSSFHPTHTFKAILKSQFIRFKLLSSLKEDYFNTCNILIKSLILRGYKYKKMNKLAKFIWSKYTVSVKPPVNQTSQTIPLILTYNSTNVNINYKVKQIINDLDSQLHVRTAWRRNPNLKTLTV